MLKYYYLFSGEKTQFFRILILVLHVLFKFFYTALRGEIYFYLFTTVKFRSEYKSIEITVEEERTLTLLM